MVFDENIANRAGREKDPLVLWPLLVLLIWDHTVDLSQFDNSEDNNCKRKSKVQSKPKIFPHLTEAGMLFCATAIQETNQNTGSSISWP